MVNNHIRKPGVAGLFYPAVAEEIRRMISGALKKEAVAMDARSFDGEILGGVVPHAGMVYCARQAVHFFEYVRRSGQRPGTVVVLHPNHSGYGPALSTDGHDFWETPMGKVPVDHGLASAMQLPVSPEAQVQEHSAEVMLPYLQYFFREGFEILSVNLLIQHYENARDLAGELHAASKKLHRDILVIASSDFSHFLSVDQSRPLDDMVLEKILEKDAEGVHQAVEKYQVSVCGYGPIMALMEYCRLMDPEYHVHLLRRGHSGEVSPSSKVVNYISMLCTLND